ncbi:MAG: potassium channel family protein [Candidatus Woesearchaeota archaeon]
MADFPDFKQILERFDQRKVRTWIDKLKFPYLLSLWVIIIISFGAVYFFFQADDYYLFNLTKQGPVDNLHDAVYFSFVAATATGFGNIIPIGYFKALAIFEVIFGLFSLTLIASKILSIKQDIVLDELYDLSWGEKVNKIRSSLLLFRQNLDRIISKVEEGVIKKREINNLHTYILSLEVYMMESLAFLGKSPQEKDGYLKNVDPVNTELIFISVLNSLDKVSELFSSLNDTKSEWRYEALIKSIDSCITLNDKLFSVLNKSSDLRKETLNDLNSRKHNVITRIRVEVARKEPPIEVVEIIMNEMNADNN